MQADKVYFIIYINFHSWTQLKQEIALISIAGPDVRMQRSGVTSVPPAGSRPSLELWCSYQQDKWISQLNWSSLWRGDETQARVRVSWRFEEIQVCGDSHISPGPQQKDAAQQQEDGHEDLDQVGGVWQRREDGAVQTVCSDTVTLMVSATVVELTVGSGPDGDTGSLSRP